MDTATSEKVTLSHYKIDTKTLIDAPPEDVWAVLTDTGA